MAPRAKRTAAGCPWIALDLERPLYGLRRAADLAVGAAKIGLGFSPHVADSVLTSGEQRGRRIRYADLLARAEAYDLDLEIRIRRRPTVVATQGRVRGPAPRVPRAQVLAVLAECGGNASEAGRRLGLSSQRVSQIRQAAGGDQEDLARRRRGRT